MQGASIGRRMNTEARISVATEEMLEKRRAESHREGLRVSLQGRDQLNKLTNLTTTYTALRVRKLNYRTEESSRCVHARVYLCTYLLGPSLQCPVQTSFFQELLHIFKNTLQK